MTRDEILATLSDHTALGLTMWAEARGDWRQGNSSVEERIAVGCVVKNRVPRWQMFRATVKSVKGICLAPNQFSCWNEGADPNHLALMQLAADIPHAQTDPLVQECLFLAVGIISGVIIDRTGGATMYYAPKAMVPAGRVPSWARGRNDGSAIGDQLFYV